MLDIEMRIGLLAVVLMVASCDTPDTPDTPDQEQTLLAVESGMACLEDVAVFQVTQSQASLDQLLESMENETLSEYLATGKLRDAAMDQQVCSMRAECLLLFKVEPGGDRIFYPDIVPSDARNLLILNCVEELILERASEGL